DAQTGEVTFADGKRVAGSTVIATDGAGSAVRNAMLHGGVQRFDFSQVWLEHGYKELHIPSASELGREIADGTDGNFLIEKNALHIWPRHKFMMIALPNYDGSFTCTLFLAHKGGEQHGDKDGTPVLPVSAFDRLTDEAAVNEFFEREFPD